MAEENAIRAETSDISRKAALRLVIVWTVLPLLFLVTGGSLEWWEAWAWCAVLLVPLTLFGLWMLRKDPGFLERRFKLKEKERTQRLVLVLGWPSLLGVLVLPGLDRRFDWSEPPLAAVIACLALVLAGYLFILRVFLENRWAGRTVETFGGQDVISTGPYSVVRHPMYSGLLLLWLSTPVALGSWWALLPALGVVPILVLRILNEEEVLKRELKGYGEYRQKVRYRLLPLVW